MDYIADDTPDAAQALKDEIETRAAHLPQSPRAYRSGRVVVGSTPVAYESPSLKSKRRSLGRFNLLSAFKIEETDEGQAKAAWLELPLWLFEAVTKDRDILSISPKYFDLTSGLDRFLYRLARRHVGRHAGWIFAFRDLHTRRGSAQPYAQFARGLRKAIARNAHPNTA